MIVLVMSLVPAIAGTDSYIFDPEPLKPGEKTSGKERVDLLCKLCWDQTYAYPSIALRYGMEAIGEAARSGYLSGSIKAHNLTGIVYDVMSVFDSALYHYHYALELSQIKGDTALIASNLTNIGLTHWHTGNFREALSYLFKALNYFEIKNSQYGQAACLNNIGLIYLDLNNSERALSSFEESLKLYSAIKNTLGMGAVTTNLGKLWSSNGNDDKAMNYLVMSEKLKISCKDNYGLTITYRYLGQLMTRLNKFAMAGKYLNKSISLTDKISDPNEKGWTLLEIANLNLKTNKPQKAYKPAQEALKLAKEVKSLKLESEVYNFLSQYYSTLKDTGKSYQYYRSFKKLEEEILNVNRVNQLIDLELQHLSKKKTNEIASLNREKNNQVVLIEEQQQLLGQRNMMLVVAAILLLITLLSAVFVFREIRQRQRRRTQVQMQALREKQLREILEAEIGERKRIGEELHDSLGQSLSLIKLNISTLRDKSFLPQDCPQPMLDNLLTLVDGAFSELRIISHNMAPIMLREKGLLAAIQDLIDRLSESTKYTIHFETIGPPPHPEPLIENTLYRVVQELINNIMHHSGANEICLQVINDGGELTIMLEDNGCGFDPDQQQNNKGIGIKNIHKRLSNLGGTVHIDSVLNRGTTVTLTIPV